jgi:hypothetical protein
MRERGASHSRAQPLEKASQQRGPAWNQLRRKPFALRLLESVSNNFLRE